eukprot:Hpha_TRINITY_DN9287_c0_g1::TRINITY_DN9287_c0_g1_i1::g.28470::m.28470
MTRIQAIVDEGEADAASGTSPSASPPVSPTPAEQAPAAPGDQSTADPAPAHPAPADPAPADPAPADPASADPASADPAPADAVPAPKRTSLQRARLARRHWAVAANATARERDLRLRYFVELWDRTLAGRRLRQRKRIEGIEAELLKGWRRRWWEQWDAVCEEKGKEKVEGALRLKEEGNQQFKEEDFYAAADTYSRALSEAPVRSKEVRATLLANRAACWAKVGRDADCVEDCGVALGVHPNNTKWLTRRMQAAERMGEDNLYKALDDAKKLVELEPCNRQALDAKRRLEPLVEARKKQQTDEALKSLKSLGNSLLGHFGLNLDMFQTAQNDDGTYSINFQQNAGKQ